MKNYSSRSTHNLKGYVVKDATGNRFTFTANHYLQPGDHVKLRGGHDPDADTHNVDYRANCNFLCNNDKDTIYLYKPSGSRANVHKNTSAATTPTATATSTSTASTRAGERDLAGRGRTAEPWGARPPRTTPNRMRRL